MFNLFKDSNFDFDKLKYQNTPSKIVFDAYYIPEDQTCPICSSSNYSKNGYKIKTVKHCIYYSKIVIVKCHIQGYVCKDCKSFFYEKDTFSNYNENISKESIDVILKMLKYNNETFESVARDLHISRQLVINIFDKYFNYTTPILPEILSFDEKHINKKLTDNAYIFIILDFLNIKIYDIVFSRHKYKLEKYFSRIPLKERENVKYITMDMWETYLDISKRYFKNALVAIDSFHVMKLVNNAMDTIRKIVMQKYNNKAEDIFYNDPYYYLLKKYRHYFLKEFDDITEGRFYNPKMKMYFTKHSLLKYMLDIDDTLKKAYYLTSKYREFNKTANITNCKEEFEAIIDLFYDSNIKQFIDVAITLENWKEYILNSFILVENTLVTSKNKSNKRRLSNGPIEGINSIIEKINLNGNGYTNFYRFRNRCIYVINSDK